jgi:Flp pilus assembly pilin Flp
MFGGASLPELGFVALLVSLVLLAPIAPRIGDAIGGLFEKHTDKRGGPA